MKDLMNKTETAKYLNLSTKSVDRLVLSKKLIKSKQGRNTVFKKENILAYVKEYITDVEIIE